MLKKMKTRLLIIIGIMIAVSSLFTIAYFTNEGLDVDRCTNDTVYKDFTGEIVLRETCIFPFTGKTITDTFIGCDVGFKNIDGVCKELGKIREKDIPIFFEIQLMDLGIEWELADRSWVNPDFEIEPPARICSHIIKESGAELYISTIWQDEYSLSDMIIQRDMPDDCVKFLPVTQIGRK